MPYEEINSPYRHLRGEMDLRGYPHKAPYLFISEMASRSANNGDTMIKSIFYFFPTSDNRAIFIVRKSGHQGCADHSFISPKRDNLMVFCEDKGCDWSV